ncbi:hypothetical protein TNCV_3464571 [Trichonephila clavipes]|nr:hypothetical protein TNCV_3464571 [Trichonephila clavipes]
MRTPSLLPSRKTNIWPSRGRRLPDNEKPHYKILQITAVNGGDKGLYIIGQINSISCRMVVDTGTNVSIIRKDLAQNIIWTPPCVSLQTVTRFRFMGKLTSL